MYRFIVSGIPKSAQASPNSKKAWQKAISEGATDSKPVGWNETRVRVVIVHFFRGGAVDLDNIAKPILDALKEIAFVDDRSVEELVVRRTELERGLKMRNAPAELLSSLKGMSDFVLH